MPTKNTQVSALVRLEELREGGRQARRTADELAAQARGAGRRRDAAANALRAFYAAQEAGDPPDPQREEELRQALADVEKRTVARSSLTQGRQVTSYYDPESEGRADAARERADRAAGLVDEFVGDRRDELEAELIDKAISARDRLMAALEELAHADGHWRTTRHRWIELDLAAADEVPPAIDLGEVALTYQQLLHGAKDRRGACPMPVRLAPTGDGEARDALPLRGWERHPVLISSQSGLGTA